MAFQFGKTKPKSKKRSAAKGVFQFKKERVAHPEPKFRKAQDLGGGEVLPEFVQGIKVGSKEEARFAVALDTLGWSYQFHKQVRGGHARRGGLEFDFFVYTRPRPTPVLVQGRYWHTGMHEDAYDTARINQWYRGRYALCLEAWDYELQSIDMAVQYVRKHFPN